MAVLKGKAVIVTGASSGIGAALARGFSHEGAFVTLAARREDRLCEVARSCPQDVLVVPTDLLQEQDRRTLVRETTARWGRVDILVNNAGMGMYGSFLQTTETAWRQIFEINLFSMVFLTQAVLPIMIARGQGLVLNLASIGGLIAHAEKVTPYVASKHAVVGFSRGLARDLAGTGIRVLAACPHLTATEFFRFSPGAEEMAPMVEKFKSFMDSPEDVAQGILSQLDSDHLVLFPTAKPAKAYAKQREI
ncbi:MAG: putative 3-oxoacyl-[acyl-carrier-protein] reductase, related to short chain alcohol dehydrogenase [Deltaproteobacteria bacterium]|nr:putative 3-oxoacyl-[acyl-carrier-protein] reductase, related to short chain alcohol dehydrogenase [Deltaproteobacteria bacterium]